MANKFHIMRKLGALLTLGCFVVCGCATKGEPATRAMLDFSSVTASVPQASASPTSPAVSPATVASLAVASPFDLVAQQFEALLKWRRECSYKPRLCNIGEFTILDTQFSDDFASMMRDYAKNNIYARPGDGQRKIDVETISQDETTMTAIVHGCVYDTVVLYMDGGIYDNKVSSSISSWTMQWHNERWYWVNHENYKKIFNTNLCES